MDLQMMNQRAYKKSFCAGIDLGSTTAKAVVLDSNGSVIFSDYRRHDARIIETVEDIFQKAREKLGDLTITPIITGSAGMGVSERLNIPFIQEVVASAEIIQRFHPDVMTLLDIGGEDSKLIFFNNNGRADIRMNGNCAGGTGAFIDQMAALLDISCDDLNSLAEQRKQVHPIASRCGVFAKTDLQALMSRGVSTPDIAISIFHAVALQSLNTLARGFEPRPKVLFSGGPLTFLPMLREVLMEKMGLGQEDVIIPPHPELISAAGAAMSSDNSKMEVSITEFLKLMKSHGSDRALLEDRDKGLFCDEVGFAQWRRNRFTAVERIPVDRLHHKDCFVGIDSGSTTTKMVLIDTDGRIALDYYSYNKGDHVSAVQEGLKYFSKTLRNSSVEVYVKGTAATGYGEDFIKTVFGLDMGVVETLAHFKAACQLVSDVSFILDIGGQDMKAMFIENGAIRKIEINEACSSGCGTFLQTFAEVLGYSVTDFSEQACTAPSPCNLGSRCTVFMNSKVKQFLREGAEVPDIAAGLAYSVVRNCLNKVLKIKDMDELGNKIVVQGGTFLNPSVQRAFEILTGKEVYCPDVAGLMGAYGCALAVKDRYLEDSLQSETIIDFEKFIGIGEGKKRQIQCKGCSNQCHVTKLQFDNGRIFYSGNRCERIFSNGGQAAHRGYNLYTYKEEILFDREYVPKGRPICTIGMPRALNIYENFPFWCTLFVELGMHVELSSPSNDSLYEKGVGTIMSDSICLPAKVMHGHIVDLIEKNVDRIFYPRVVYEKHEQKGHNSFNCPIVTGYPDVVVSAINPDMKYGVPIDTPTLSFKDIELLKKACWDYFKQFKISKKPFFKAFQKALSAQKEFKAALRTKGRMIVEKASREGLPVIIMAGRPYHLDRFINHEAPEMLSQLGVDVITADSIPSCDSLDHVQALTQWEYTNWLYGAAEYANRHKNVEIVQLNSFGCGLDIIAMDEIQAMLAVSGKNLTVLRIDEVASPGSIKLRLRTMVEAMKFKHHFHKDPYTERTILPPFRKRDRGRKILVPHFSAFYSPFIKSFLGNLEYNFEMLPPPDEGSLEKGLKYANNEICYPAIIVVGDILRALETEKYDRSQVAVGITQTGGQCRATNYVTLIKKGLMNAGFDHIPVITVHLESTNLNYQPGFKLNKQKLIKDGFYSLVLADALSMMYHSMSVREKRHGEAWKIVGKYMDIWDMEKNRSQERVLALLGCAVKEFNHVSASRERYPKIGLVGEIYVQYNEFSNHNVVKWLSQKGIEVEVPSLIHFFTQVFANLRVDREEYLRRTSLLQPVANFLEKKTDRFLERANSVLESYKFYRPFHHISELAEKASQVVDLANQAGEGWLIPGEVISMAERGIENIVCLQPFGCIANQVIAKGIEKRLRDLYPSLNILFLDLDANTSEANMFNRLHFLMKSAKVSMLSDSPSRKVQRAAGF